MTENQVKQIFMFCSNEDPNGIYSTDVDLLEFANKLETVIQYKSNLMRFAIKDAISWYESGDAEPFPIESLKAALDA